MIEMGELAVARQHARPVSIITISAVLPPGTSREISLRARASPSSRLRRLSPTDTRASEKIGALDAAALEVRATRREACSALKRRTAPAARSSKHPHVLRHAGDARLPPQLSGECRRSARHRRRSLRAHSAASGKRSSTRLRASLSRRASPAFPSLRCSRGYRPAARGPDSDAG